MNLNTIKYSRFTFQEILSGNDDFIVSDAISDLLNEYQDNIYTKIDTPNNLIHYAYEPNWKLSMENLK